MSFSRDVNRWAKKAGLTMDEASRGIKIELFSSVIRDTRIKSGRLCGNWQTSTGSPKTGTIDRLDPSRSKAIAEVKNTVKGDTVDYIVNNLDYAEIWEEREAMIGRNVARIKSIARKAAK